MTDTDAEMIQALLPHRAGLQVRFPGRAMNDESVSDMGPETTRRARSRKPATR